MENNNNGRQTRQDIEIAKINTDLEWLKREFIGMKTQVFNHIPTQLSAIERQCVKRTDFGVGIGIVVVIQIILKFFL